MGIEKITGKAKQAASAVSGKWGILNRLESEHSEVAALMDTVLDASSHVEAAQEHYPTIRKKLLVHTNAEAQVFYTACEDHDELADLIPTSRSEHDEIERTLETLDRTPYDAPAWLEEFETLQQIFEQHVEDEEENLFEQAKETFDASELRDLDDDYVDAKDVLEDEIEELPAGRPEHRPIA